MVNDKNMEDINSMEDIIEVEQIDVDIDKNYDISLDISSLPEIETEGKSINIDQTIDISNTLEKIEDTEVIESTCDSEIGSFEEENTISISNEELDNILEGASIKEEEIEDIGINIEGNEISSIDQVQEGIFTKVEKIDEVPISDEAFKNASESISLESEIVSQKATSDKSDIIVMSTEDYNRIVEQEQVVPIVDKPSEEIIDIDESISSDLGLESISPEEVGVSTELTSKESQLNDLEYDELQIEELDNSMYQETKSTFPEDLGIVDTPVDITATKEIDLDVLSAETREPEKSSIDTTDVGEIELKTEDIQIVDFEEVSEPISSDQKYDKSTEYTGTQEIGDLSISSFEDISLESTELIQEITTPIESEKLIEESISKPSVLETFEVIDDISLDVSETSKEFSVMPDEVGFEEIKVGLEEAKEEILGIGFERTSEVGITEEAKEIERSIEDIEKLQSQTLETKEISRETLTSYEEKVSKIESSIESLSEEEKDDIRKVLQYLDKLLENLPEDKIKEFASSEYYDLYMRIFDKLKIK
ncbi:MAG: hypothetical protein N2712_07655 [Brevinematales bacterium]|nr:hypothetical protein [Brevinematales bacterium]